MKEFKDIVTDLGLKIVPVQSEGKTQDAFIGFEEYHDAFDIARLYHKRLAVIHRQGTGEWTDKNIVPYNDTNIYQLVHEDTDDVFICDQKNVYDEESQKLLDAIIDKGGSAKEYAEMLAEINKTKMILSDVKHYGRPSYVLDLKEGRQYGPYYYGTSIKFKDEEIAIALLEVEEDHAQRIAPLVAGKAIVPCVSGQMPEDFIDIMPHNGLNRHFHDYADSDGRHKLGPFLIYDEEGHIGYGYRESFDTKFWRWNIESHETIITETDIDSHDMAKHDDYDVFAWSIPESGTPDPEWGGFKSDPFHSHVDVDTAKAAYYKSLSEEQAKTIQQLKEDKGVPAIEDKLLNRIYELENQLKAALSDKEQLERQLAEKQKAEATVQNKKRSKGFILTNLTGRIVITDGTIYVNGKKVDKDSLGTSFPIGSDTIYDLTLEGNVDSLQTDTGDITVNGTAGTVRTTSGDIHCQQDVKGSAQSVSGDISVKGNVLGSCSTVSGDIRR